MGRQSAARQRRSSWSGRHKDSGKMESFTMTKTIFVTTTIHIPTFLTAYALDAERYGHQDVSFIVIGDKKSPTETADFCETIPNCIYMDVNDQEIYMAEFPELW